MTNLDICSTVCKHKTDEEKEAPTKLHDEELTKTAVVLTDDFSAIWSEKARLGQAVVEDQ